MCRAGGTGREDGGSNKARQSWAPWGLFPCVPRVYNAHHRLNLGKEWMKGPNLPISQMMSRGPEEGKRPSNVIHSGLAAVNQASPSERRPLCTSHTPMKSTLRVPILWQVGPECWSPGAFWALSGDTWGNFNELFFFFLTGIMALPVPFCR